MRLLNLHGSVCIFAVILLMFDDHKEPIAAGSIRLHDFASFNDIGQV